ncbi:MAG TPA: FAD-linked oxidase C-terminal domain-containing protein [Solirubrobacteraceae bacterium]|nr:FAD-linked oxidase C-terminal domain-containing protein [Solirubrobacteraceae bacterium]
MSQAALIRDLGRALGPQCVLAGDAPGARAYLADATASRGVSGHADAVLLPADAAGVAAALAFADAHDIPVTPRGGGSGYAAGAVPHGGLLLSVERLTGAPQVAPERWSLRTPAGVTTATVRRRAAESGLLYPPDPGSLEQCLIGGNIATNAGGPHTFKYGVTGRWVRALTVAVMPGRLVELGHGVSKDVSGLDLRSLMIGSEGTLGIICAAELALVPAPEVRLPVLARYPDTASGCAAIGAVLASGAIPAALEYLDGAAAGDGGFVVLAEADGAPAAAAEQAARLREALTPGATSLQAPSTRAEISALWRWREGLSLAITARRGGKLSEDIVVPVTRLEAAIDAVGEIGARHGLEACSWGHAGDGNLHATFLIDRDDPTEIRRAEAAAEELFDLAVALDGSLSGEHGIGTLKRGAAARLLTPEVIALQAAVKAALDPKGLLNPGKKLPARPVSAHAGASPTQMADGVAGGPTSGA